MSFYIKVTLSHINCMGIKSAYIYISIPREFFRFRMNFFMKFTRLITHIFIRTSFEVCTNSNERIVQFTRTWNWFHNDCVWSTYITHKKSISFPINSQRRFDACEIHMIEPVGPSYISHSISWRTKSRYWIPYYDKEICSMPKLIWFAMRFIVMIYAYHVSEILCYLVASDIDKQ